MSKLEQKIAELTYLRENAKKYQERRRDLEKSILEEGKKLLHQCIPNLIWKVDVLNADLMRLRLKGGDKFDTFMETLRKLGKMSNSRQIYMTFDDYEVVVDYTNPTCRIIDIFKMDERRGRLLHYVRGVELMTVYRKYFNLDLPSVEEIFREKIYDNEEEIKILERRVRYLESMKACLLGGKV